jgi:Na+/melibiose symporter-like transporter
MKMNFRIFIVVVPIILISLAYLVMMKKNKIDEETYDRMMLEISQRKQAE